MEQQLPAPSREEGGNRLQILVSEADTGRRVDYWSNVVVGRGEEHLWHSQCGMGRVGEYGY